MVVAAKTLVKFIVVQTWKKHLVHNHSKKSYTTDHIDEDATLD